MTDFLLLEKISRLTSRTPRPRLLHQKGIAARGSFAPYMSLSDYTRAEFLRDPQVETCVTARFSRTTGEKGSGDSFRDTRGFAVRFETEQGDYDLLCHNMPVYYISSPSQFPAMVETLMPEDRQVLGSGGFWKFLSENPQAVNLAVGLYSDRGTLKSYRFMEGYSANTYKWVNDRQEELYIRYRWVPLCEREEDYEKRKGVSSQEAEFLAGFSPDCCVSDFALAVEEGNFPVYELEAQMMEPDQAKRCGFDFLSPSLYWPEENFPYIKIGKMVLNQVLKKEQEDALCFRPGKLVDGIEPGNLEFFQIMDYAHRDGGRQRGAKQ